LLDDAGAHYRNSSGVSKKSVTASGADMSSTFYQDWQDYDTRMARVSSAVSGSGGIAKMETVGYSVQNRPIMGVRFTGQGWQSGGPRVIVDFQLHAREWIVGMAGVYAVEAMIQKAQDDPSWLSGMEIVVVPTVNPDGTIYSETSERFWRKNMRVNSGSSCLGVDLNRNFGVMWSVNESSNRCSDTFYGSAAFSEPESQAIKNLVDEAPVTLHLDVHSYSEVILAPWSYSYDPHPRRAEIDVPGRAMTDAVNAKFGKNYRYGGSEILYTAAGVCPDYATSQGGFGYTYELRPGRYGGGGFAPPANQIAPATEETWAGIEAGINWAKDPSATPAPPAPTPPPACQDLDSRCGSWIGRGWCQTYYDYMQQNCCATCNR